MKKSQITLTNYPYHKMSMMGTLNSLANMGIRNLEFLASEPDFYLEDVAQREASELKQQLLARELKMVCLSIPCNECSVNLITNNSNTRKRSIDYIVKGIEYANFFETPAVQFCAGEVRMHEDEGAAWLRAQESLLYLSEIADGYGVKIINNYTDSIYTNVLCGAANVKKMHESIGARKFLKMSDTVYMEKLSETAEDLQGLFGDDLYMVHFADCKDSLMHLAPGEGTLDLEKQLKALDAIGFKGYLSLNMRGSRVPYSYEVNPGKCMESGVQWMLEHLEND